MLENTFHHMPGIGIKSEQSLWDAGVMAWKDLSNPKIAGISRKRLANLEKHVDESVNHMENNYFKYFEELLPAALHWRFFPEVRKKTAYLDIETTGLEGYDEITTIALYDGENIRYYVNGENLDHFPAHVQDYTTVVTYNGKCFDIPFIERYFQISMPHVHIDLRYVLKSLGYGGGLKACEKKMGIDRGELDGVDGYFAVHLWNDYKRRKNEKSLETLLAYNIEDVVNLEILMVKAYNEKIQDTPFARTHVIPLPHAPEIPFKAHTDTVKRLQAELL